MAFAPGDDTLLRRSLGHTQAPAWGSQAVLRLSVLADGRCSKRPFAMISDHPPSIFVGATPRAVQSRSTAPRGVLSPRVTPGADLRYTERPATAALLSPLQAASGRAVSAPRLAIAAGTYCNGSSTRGGIGTLDGATGVQPAPIPPTKVSATTCSEPIEKAGEVGDVDYRLDR